MKKVTYGFLLDFIGFGVWEWSGLCYGSRLLNIVLFITKMRVLCWTSTA